MSLKMITPFTIDDSNMTSDISEPDVSQGEVEWFAKASGVDAGFYVAGICNTGDGYITCLQVPIGPGAYLVRKVVIGTSTTAYSFSIEAQTTNAQSITWNGVNILVASYGEVHKYTNAGVFVSTHSLPALNGSPRIGWDGDSVLLVMSGTKKIIKLNSDFTENSNFQPDIAGNISGLGYSYPYYYALSDGLGVGYQLIGESMTGVTVDLSRADLSPPRGFVGIGSLFFMCDFQDFIYMYDESFNSIANYDEGQVVCFTGNHSLYSAVTSTDDNPIVGAELIPPTWVRVSASNKYKAFDYVINTKSVMTTTNNQVELNPLKACGTVSVFGMSGVSAVIVEVYSNKASYDASESYVDRFVKNTKIDAPDIDGTVNDNLYADKVIFDELDVTISEPYILIKFFSFDASFGVGDIVIGNSRSLGVTTYQSSTSRTSYDTVDTDDFGNETITSRPSAEYTSFEVMVYPEYANYVERILKESLNKPRVYVGDKGNNEKIFTFGYYERSPITYASPKMYETTLKVRGLV